MDARKMEAQLVRLNQSPETAGITTSDRCIVQMFREYIATLDEAIKSAHTPRTRRNVRLSAWEGTIICGRYYSLFDKQQVAEHFHLWFAQGQLITIRSGSMIAEGASMPLF
jgi:hypothetical protein